MSDRKHNRYGIDSLIGFLATRPTDERYEFFNIEECACGQFLTSIGARADEHAIVNHELGSGGYGFVFHGGGGTFHLAYHGWTFGDALERARKWREMRKEETC